MSFAKFVATLEYRALFFSRVDTLRDGFEGSLSRVNVQIDSELSAEVGLAMTYREVRDLVRRLHRETFVNCWHMSENESMAMWKAYAGDADSVAIQSTYGRLRDVLDPAIWIGAVRYIDYKTDPVAYDWVFLPFLHKRRIFDGERELRALFQRPLGTSLGHYESVNLVMLIESVYVSPAAGRWFATLVANTLIKYGILVPVRPSEHDQEPFV